MGPHLFTNIYRAVLQEQTQIASERTTMEVKPGNFSNPSQSICSEINSQLYDQKS